MCVSKIHHSSLKHLIHSMLNNHKSYQYSIQNLISSREKLNSIIFCNQIIKCILMSDSILLYYFTQPWLIAIVEWLRSATGLPKVSTIVFLFLPLFPCSDKMVQCPYQVLYYCARDSYAHGGALAWYRCVASNSTGSAGWSTCRHIT